MRKIVIDAEDFDRPVDLQAIQEATARWNGQTIDLTWNLVIGGSLEILRAPITTSQATRFAARLKAALSKATPKKKKRKPIPRRK
jgi:hypothetical protein